MELENRKNMLARLIHHNIAMIGGFFGGYAVLSRGDFLANAQTANLMRLAFTVLGGNMEEFLLRLNALFLYCLSCFLCVIIKKKTSYNIKLLAVFIDAVAIIILGIIPGEVRPIIALIPVFIAMPFQWNAFPGSYGYNSSTIFSSNNVRQIMVGLADYICDRDYKHIHRAVFFLGSVIAFNIGAVMSYFSVEYFQVRGIWLCLLLLVPVTIMILKEKHMEE